MAKQVIVEGQTATNPQTGDKIVYRGGKWYPYTPNEAPTVDVKEFQAKAGAQSVLMDQALTDYQRAQQQGYNPASPRNALAMGLESWPLVGSFAADVVRDDVSEQGRGAELAYTEGALRALTGAAATDPETKRTARNMFRQPGESAAVEANKEATRQRFAASVQRTAGPAYAPASPTRDPAAYRLPEGASRGQPNSRARPGGNRPSSGKAAPKRLKYNPQTGRIE